VSVTSRPGWSVVPPRLIGLLDLTVKSVVAICRTGRRQPEASSHGPRLTP
jgi:hypothetical protein